MTEIQGLLLKLLQEIDQICTKYEIDYYVFGGTMLGIERNEGFLPWDDDIDIVMTKKNYEQFSKIMEDKPPINRHFECIEKNKEYPLQFGRYTSMDTSGITRSLAFGNSSAGVWVDIVYVAPLPTSARKVKRIQKWFSCYCELENEIYVEYKNHYKGFYWRYRICLFCASIFGKEKTIAHMKKWFDGFSEDECNMYFMYHSLFTDFRAFEKRFFEKPVRKKFEGVNVNVSPYNREFCRVLYGDSWMIVPEVSQQETHTIVFDLDIPYNKYVNDYMVFLNKKTVAGIICEVKQLQLKNFEYLRSSVTDRNYLKGLLVNEALKNQISQEKIDLKELLYKQDFITIKRIYKEYLTCQFDQEFLMWDVFVALDDDLLYPVVMMLICYEGQYYNAEKILKLRVKNSKDILSEDLQYAKLLIKCCRQLSTALWDKQDYNLAKKILTQKEFNEIDDFCIDIELCRCYISLYEAETTKNYQPARLQIRKLLGKIPMQGEGIKLLGDLEMKLGNKDKAMNYYCDAEKITHNGLVLLDIQRKKEVYNNEM